MTDAGNLSGLKVLLLEDEAIVGLYLLDALEEAGLRVCGPIPTCAEALSWLSGAEADAAVIDLGLADGNSAVVARELRRRGVPFVLFSGDPWASQAMLREFGNPPVVEKPAGPDDVLAALVAARAGAVVPLHA